MAERLACLVASRRPVARVCSCIAGKPDAGVTLALQTRGTLSASPATGGGDDASVNSSAAPASAIGAGLLRVPPQALFVCGAISQYAGSAVAVLLFDRVPAAGVAW